MTPPSLIVFGGGSLSVLSIKSAYSTSDGSLSLYSKNKSKFAFSAISKRFGNAFKEYFKPIKSLHKN